jgi:hypothetical protein
MSKPYPQSGEVIPWVNERGIQCVRLGVPGMGEQVRIQQNGQSGVRVNVNMIDALCEALQAAKKQLGMADAVSTIRRMRELEGKARDWIEVHGTTLYDDRDDQIKDVMEELTLTDERDADVVLELVKNHAQVFVEFDMGTMFTPEELAAAE